jgi:ankyrin repeat protein
MSKPESERLLKELERHKATLGLALEADSFSTLIQACSRQETAVTEGFERIDASLSRLTKENKKATQILLNTHRRKILSFFGTVDPGKNQRTGMNLLHSGTGLWFTDGDEFKSWRDNGHSRLWIYGIPGAGKTILMARIIDLLEHDPVAADGLAYFYCDYKDDTTHNPIEIFGSIARQFAVQHEKAFDELEELYKRHELGTRQHTLTINELQSLITRQAAHFRDPCVLVDGLDECSDNRMSVLEALVSLVDSQENGIKALLASRDEHDIRSSMESADFAEISIAAKSSDLKLYVLAEIERRTKTGRLNIRRPAVKEEIMAKLVDKAEGMFRWVSCQIDYLCELNSDKDRLEALNTLPPTLPKTYERILARVNDSGASNQRLVRKTFQWLARMQVRISPDAFAEALSIDNETERLDPDCIIDENAVSKLCGSLVRRSVDAEGLEFAHFTVEEFLRAINPEDRQFAHYRLVGDEADKEIATTCLCYLNLANFSKPLPPVEEMDAIFAKYRLLEYAAFYWIYHANAHQGEKSLESLIRRLFRPAKSQNFLYWAIAFLYAAYDNNQYYSTKRAWSDYRGMWCDLIAETSVLHWASLLALPATVKWLLDSDVRCEQSSRLGYPIHFATGGTVWLFKTINIRLPTLTISASDQVATIALLSESGARVDLTGKEYPAPIQLAVVSDFWKRDRDWPAATAILKAGAPVHHNLFAELRKYFGQRDIERGNNSLFDPLLDTIIARDDKILEDSGFLDVAQRFGGLCTLEHLRHRKPVANDNEDASLPNVELLRDAIKEMRTDAVKCLVQGQRQLPSIVIDDKDALFHVVSHDLLEILRILLDHGMEPTCKDQEENTLLHYAAETASSDLITDLMGRGLQISDANKAGKTPIMMAAAGKNLSGVETIISIVEVNGTALQEVNSDGQTLLHYAARGGSLEVLKRIYEFNGTNNLKAINSKGQSVLDMAVESQSLPVVEFLLGQGLKPHEPGHQQMATLHRAILCANNEDGFKIVEVLVRGGASAASVYTDGKTPLHLLAESIYYQNYDNNLEDLLIRQGANINALDSSGRSPIQLLCHAAINVNDEIGLGYFGRALNRLLSHGAKTNVVDRDENSVLQVVFDKLTMLTRLCQNYAPYYFVPLDYASLLEAFVLVLNQGSWNSILRTRNRDGSLWSEILRQADQVSVEAILRKLEATPTENLDAVHFSLVREACIQGISRANFQRLVQPFKDVLDSFDQDDERIIHHATLANHREILQVLLDLGIDVNTRTGNTWSTPLMLAAKADSLEALELLLAKGATIDAKDLRGYTVYHYACTNGHVRIMRRLDFDAAPMEYRGLRVRAYGDQGVSCLHLAAGKGWSHAIDYLLRNCKVEDINGTTMHGFTSLHFAVQSCCREAVTLLLDGGADLSLTTADLESPLHLAARDGTVEIMNLLIEQRPDLIDAKDTHGATALHICSGQGHVGAVRCLLESGADASLVNSDGATAEHLAFLGRHERIVDLLREASPANSKLPPIFLSTAVPSCGATLSKLRIMTFLQLPKVIFRLHQRSLITWHCGMRLIEQICPTVSDFWSKEPMLALL